MSGAVSAARVTGCALPVGSLPARLAHRCHVVDLIHDELPDVPAAAAVVVARSGAGTVAELTALGKGPHPGPVPGLGR
ncbi:hypothetical protein J3R03_007586 [Actinoplanes couchii]|nr:hypothetical protein [Actinoplanes couchii]